MSQFIKKGSMFTVTDDANLDVHKSLPAGHYIVCFDPNMGWFFQQCDGFDLPSKIYGSVTETVDRILSTYSMRRQSTGVLLSGEKGSGKTLISKMVSMQALAKGIPTLVINTPFNGDSFNKLIQQIDQPCIVLFDEFEKVYDRDEQQALLTLLDGVFPSSKLFLFTCNDKWRIDNHMTNRPGRIYYALEYGGLDQAFVREYCIDNLKNQAYVDSVCRIGSLFDKFNFDMLKALVEEMNRYDESPLQSLKYLNAKPDADSGGTYEIDVYYKNIKCEGYLYPSSHSGNPLNQAEYNFSWQPDSDVKIPGLKRNARRETYQFHFSLEHMTSVDAEKGEFTFINDEQESRAVFRRKKSEGWSWKEGVDQWFGPEFAEPDEESAP